MSELIDQKPDEVVTILDFGSGIDRYYVSLAFDKDDEVITNNNIAMNEYGDYYHDDTHFSQADVEDGFVPDKAKVIEWEELPEKCRDTVWSEVFEINGYNELDENLF